MADPTIADGDNTTTRQDILQVGKVVADRYRLIDLLGRGGMGEVYLAEHIHLKKKVAVKLLNRDVTDDDEFVERFRREAQAAAHIEHPNVCAATDFGQAFNERFFLVMEYVEGENLDDLMDREGRMGLERSLRIAKQVSAAVGEAHKNNVIHRDLKPANIMLTRGKSGEDEELVKVTDFGIAQVRLEDGAPDLTQSGVVFGTPSYMAPEQAMGDEVDQRVDLYAIGVLLFEMITGRPLFETDSSMQMMRMHVVDEPPIPSQRAPEAGIPPLIDRLVKLLLSKDPDDRPKDADELCAAIDRVLDELDPEAIEEYEQKASSPQTVGSWDEYQRQGTIRERVSQVVEKWEQTDDGDRDVLQRIAALIAKYRERLEVPIALGTFGVVVLVASLTLSLIRGDFTEPESEPTPGDIRDELVAERSEYESRPKIEEALADSRDGQLSAAISSIEALREESPDDPHLAFLEGDLSARASQWKRAVTAMGDALEAKPEYRHDLRLKEVIVQAYLGGAEEARPVARKLLKEKLSERSINEGLATMAWKSSSSRVRERAANFLEETGRLEKVPKYHRLAIALRESRGCHEHRKNIEALADLGDPRGKGVLQIYSDKPKTGCGTFDNEDCYGCIRTDLREAISELEAAEHREQKQASAQEKTSPADD